MPNIDAGLMARKHCGDFLRQHNLRDAATLAAHDLEWSQLGKIKRDAKREMSDLIDKLADGTDNRRGAEIEAASDELSLMVQIIDREMDERNEIGNRSTRPDPMIAKRPQFEDRISPAVDNGYTQPTEDSAAYSLRSSDKYRAWAQPRATEQFNGLSLGSYFRSMISGCQNEQEARALSEGTNSAGGFTVPSILSATLIDKLRAQSVAIQAGCRTIPMSSDNLSIAKVATEPSPAFRNEAAAITETDPTFSIVQMAPSMLAMMTKVSVELMADTVNLQTELPNIITRAMAAEMDRVVFQGTGSAPEPRGIINQSGIGNTGAGGALTNYAELLTAMTGIATLNAGPPSAIVMHPRDYGTLAGLVATDNQPLMMPPALQGIPMLQTSALQVDAGAGNSESNIVMGNFSNCLIAMRNQIQIQVLRERYADTGELAFIAMMRFDVALTHPESFHKVSGITP
jgi:HK97 family phage major capsid protein